MSDPAQQEHEPLDHLQMIEVHATVVFNPGEMKGPSNTSQGEFEQDMAREVCDALRGFKARVSVRRIQAHTE